MRGFTTLLLTAAAFGPVKHCEGKICYSIAIYKVAERQGNAYMQITAPASTAWAAIGTGTMMAGATMFVVYADGAGNVTISPRKGTGHVQPQLDSGINVQRLSGSGINGDIMNANFVVSFSDIDLAANKSPWIGASFAGPALNSASTSATIRKHNNIYGWTFDLPQALIDQDANPYGIRDSVNDGKIRASGGGEDRTSMFVGLHAIVACLAFLIIYPLGTVLMLVVGRWFTHAVVQFIGFMIMWVAFGIGVSIAVNEGLLFKQTHTILGTIVVCLMVFQPVMGLVHHRSHSSGPRRKPVTWAHIWFGRILIALGIVNGGFGLQLAGASLTLKIAYAVVAGIVTLFYLVIKGLCIKRGASGNYKP